MARRSGGAESDDAHLLDMPRTTCRAGVLARGPRYGGADSDSQALLAWAEAYSQRTTPSSFAGHHTIFESFPRTKFRLRSRAEVSELLVELAAGHRIDAGSASDSRRPA
jgi:hypothetical protein